MGEKSATEVVAVDTSTASPDGIVNVGTSGLKPNLNANLSPFKAIAVLAKELLDVISEFPNNSKGFSHVL